MQNIDVELIHRTLDGDDAAFTKLVNKYQKPVHALVWRKIGDFHIAEEITQDTFLRAYQGLSTLKKPQSFASWLYVIAANRCSTWLRKKRLQTQPLEETDSALLEKATYSRHVSEENKRTAVEAKREVVKRLLAKLQESDRTVITLHYFGDMSAAEIGAFLGVSVNTIKSRLRRAQQRLKKEEPMVREALEHFQITPHLTENIMREVSRMKPVIPSGSKPLVPVALSAATAILIFLIIGIGAQYLARFQKPYNIDAQSETTVEIIDAPIVLDVQAKPDLRSQAGRFDTIGKRSSTGSQLSEPVTLGAAQLEKETHPSTQQQWIQASGPEGGSITGLLANSSGDVYAASPVGIYRLSPDAQAWTLVNTTVPTTDPTNSGHYDLIPMAASGDILYLVSIDEVFASIDRGETWKSLGVRPKGPAIDLVATDKALYLGLQDGDVFRFTETEKQWTLMSGGTSDSKIYALTAIEDTVFVGTNRGLYRLNSGVWKKLSVGTTRSVQSLAVSGNNLYIGTGPDIYAFNKGIDPKAIGQMFGGMLMGGKGAWEIFHSTDLGNSWTEITPTSRSVTRIISLGIKVVAVGDTLLALGMGGFRSTDRGQTWTEFALNENSMTLSIFPAVAGNENTFFKVGPLGATRSSDGGTSWHPFMAGMVGTRILNLVRFKNSLYANTGTTVVKSVDGGASWKRVLVDFSVSALEPIEERNPTDRVHFPKLTVADDVFYIVTPEKSRLRIVRMSVDGNTLTSIAGMPVLGENVPSNVKDSELQASYEEVMADDAADTSEKSGKLTGIFSRLFESLQTEEEVIAGGFAVSGDTFYVEYKRRLFKWEPGEPEWVNTGLIDASEQIDDDFDRGFQLAVSGETVYVGKRDGHLFRSLDGGDTWRDLTPNLPLRFTRFSEIRFAGSTVYVATDTGILASQTGENWRAITDKVGTHIVIDRLAVAGTKVYGAGNAGVYALNSRNKWEKIPPEVPDSVVALVINGKRLYVATEKRGMFHISLENENN